MTREDPITQGYFFLQGILVIATLGQMQSLMAVMRKRQPLWVSSQPELLLFLYPASWIVDSTLTYLNLKMLPMIFSFHIL